MVKKKTKKKISTGVSLFAGVTLCYFIWLSWQKLTAYIGNSNLAWIITGTIVILAVTFGFLGTKKILKKF